MASVTDPAYELGEIAQKLCHGSSKTGEVFLAERFGVAPWSTEFVLILSCIYQRIDLVARSIQRDDVDLEFQETAQKVLTNFKGGFTSASLRNAWHNAGGGLTAMKDSEHALKMMSSTVRQRVSYPKLTGEEVAEFLDLSSAYLEALRDASDEPDFVRQAIVDGVIKFRFQLEHLGWMGAGYVLESLRELMFVYGWASQRSRQQHELDAGAVLKGLGALLTRIKKTVDAAESWKKSGTAVWQAYQLVSTVAVPALLLTHQSGGA